MSRYVDIGFYGYPYHGDKFPDETTARKWLARASDVLNKLTFGRLDSAFPTNELHAEMVRKCVCAIAEILFAIEIQKESTSSHVSTRVNSYGEVEICKINKPISSISSGQEKISYDTSPNNIYFSAAVNPAAANRLIAETAASYLANVPDANGVNLLYAGEV